MVLGRVRGLTHEVRVARTTGQFRGTSWPVRRARTAHRFGLHRPDTSDVHEGRGARWAVRVVGLLSPVAGLSAVGHGYHALGRVGVGADLASVQRSTDESNEAIGCHGKSMGPDAERHITCTSAIHSRHGDGWPLGGQRPFTGVREDEAVAIDKRLLQAPPMTPEPVDRVSQLMHAGDQAAWSAAALVLVLARAGSEDQLQAATDVIRAQGVDPNKDLGDRDRAGRAAQMAAPLLQAAALVRGDGDVWSSQSDEALRAQGAASAQGVQAMKQFLLPMLAGLAESMDRPGARMLDVGTGVAALAVAWAEAFEHLTVVAIDVLPRVLVLARETVAASSAKERVLLRQQDVSTLDERAVYNLVWLPAPFLPEPALRTGVERAAPALVNGGWLMVGHGKYGGGAVEDAVGRFKTVAYGGTALDDDQAQQLLRDTAFTEVMTLPTPLGAPALTVGRRVPGSATS